MTDAACDSKDLNADAVYAGMVWLRDQAQANGDLRLPQPQSAFLDWAESALERATVTAVPKINTDAVDCEAIYPGERLSVEVGIDLARLVIWGPEAARNVLANPDSNDPTAIAVRRFLAN